MVNSQRGLPEEQAETALEKEWREIKEANETERSKLQQTDRW